jgi:hypothetical protein
VTSLKSTKSKSSEIFWPLSPLKLPNTFSTLYLQGLLGVVTVSGLNCLSNSIFPDIFHVNITRPHVFQGPSWPWSYGSWIYNYLSNQSLSPLMLWVRISIRARCRTLCDQIWQWFVTGRGFLRVLRFPPPIKLTATI